MTVALVCLALSVCPSRGGHAIEPPARGGQAVALVERVKQLAAWVCIHGHEAKWDDTGDPYWGGLQMDREFMSTYGRDMLAKYHGRWADAWTPRDQILVAQDAYESGRGFGPWPATAAMCGYPTGPVARVRGGPAT